MNKAALILMVGAIAASTAGCASQMRSESKDGALLSEPEFKSGSASAWSEAELRGETAVIYGDDQTAVKLFERSVAEHPTLLKPSRCIARSPTADPATRRTRSVR